MRSLVLPLILLSAACGDDGPTKQIDAGDSIDSQNVDADLGAAVKLTITSNGTGLAGVRVHFQGPDSAVIASVMTDTNGVASSKVPAGGFVTAVNPFAGAPGGSSAQLKTFSGVQPGDELILTEDYGGAGLDLAITAPVDASGTVTGYRFTSPCDDSESADLPPVTPSYSMPLDSRCVPTTDLLVASHNVNDEIVNFLFAPNVTTSGGTANLTSMSLNTAATTKTYTFNNMPTDTELGLGVELYSTKGKIIDFEGGGIGTAVEQPFKIPGFTGAVEVVFGVYATMYGMVGIADWAPFSATAYTVDAGARALRAATSGATFDKTAKRVSWTEAATGVAGDFVVAETEIYRATGSLYIYWEVIAEADAPEVQYPTLPVESIDYNVQSTDTTDTFVTVGKVPGGWNAIREKFFAIDGPLDLGNGSTTGSLTFQGIGDADQLFAPMQRLRNIVSPAKRNPLAAAWKSRRRM